MNDMELEARLQSYYSEFTPESSVRAVAGVGRVVADRRALPARPLADLAGLFGRRSAGALVGVAVAVVLVVALVPIWGRLGTGPTSNGTPDVANAFVGQAGMTRGGVLWAVRGQGLSISKDYGQTWTEHQLPQGTYGYPIVVADADHAWVLSTLIQATVSPLNAYCLVYRTADGGATWQTSTLSCPSSSVPPQMRFVNDKVGIIALSSDEGLGAITIMRTDDGGATWHSGAGAQIYTPAATATPQGPEASPSDVVRWDQDVVVPVGATTLWTYCSVLGFVSGASIGDNQCSGPLLEVSRDAGATWSSVPLPGVGANAGATLRVVDSAYDGADGVQFVSATEGYVAVLEAVASNSRVHYFRTTDGGSNWTQVALTEWQQVSFAPIFIDSQHWVQPGLGQHVIWKDGATAGFLTPDGVNVTSDGGKTWKNVGTELGSLPYLWMSDPQHGAALASGPTSQILYLTSDGGESWHVARLNPAQWPDPVFPTYPIDAVPTTGS